MGRERAAARREVHRATLAARIAAAGDARKVDDVLGSGGNLHVRQLNPGFFMLERMRASTAVKKRAKARKQPEGK